MQSGRRKEARTAQCIPVTCTCKDPKVCYRCELTGITINKSKSGMCIYTFGPIKQGSPLSVECEFNGIRIKNATVKWCEEVVNNKVYKIGIALD
jgi:hypothetical protein